MASTSSTGTTIQEFSIRVPKNTKKTYKVMRFNSSVNVDFNKWSQVKMERENNLKEFRGNEEDLPKFGAGSEFGRESREEARRKKYGIVSKKYRAEDQPWILKVGGKTGKKFKGTREGGVSENAAYYVFTHAADGAIEAFPLQEWYNFQPTQRYKALSAEEAEQEFGRRNKQVNYFSLMMRKRLRGENDEEIEEGEEMKAKGKSKAKKGDLKISEMDDWVDSSESSDSDEENKDQDKEKEEKEKKKKDVNAKKKKKRDPDDEAFEESDDGDEEGREVDYISDSSESASDHETKATKELKGVEEEDALRKLLSSGEEDEEEEEKEKEEEEEKEEETVEKGKGDLPILMRDEKEKKSKKKTKDGIVNKKKEDGISSGHVPNQDSSSEMSSDLSDSDNEQKKKNGNKGTKETSRISILADCGFV